MTPDDAISAGILGSDYAAGLLSAAFDAFPPANTEDPTVTAQGHRLDDVLSLARTLVREDPAVVYAALITLTLAAAGVLQPVVEIPDELRA